MAQRLRAPLQNSDPESTKTGKSQKKKPQKRKMEHQKSDSPYIAMDALSESSDDIPRIRERSFSTDSLADGNRRRTAQNDGQNSADFFRFPEPKTLVADKGGIGLYSPLVSTRDARFQHKARSNATIYEGVPSYLNPNLMRQRRERSQSAKSQRQRDVVRQRSLPVMKSRHNKSQNENDEPFLESVPMQEIKPQRPPMKGQHHRNYSRTVPDREGMFKQRRGSGSAPALSADQRKNSREWHWTVIDEESPAHRKSSDHKDLSVSYVKATPQKRLLEDFNTIWKRAYFALIILATLNGLLTFCVSKVAATAWELTAIIYEYSGFQIAYKFPAYILIVLLKLILVLIAIFLTRTLAPNCAGSGVPELRAILSGIWIRQYLSRTTFAVKLMALCFSLSSGLPIGLEGPFIHISSIMGRQLTKLSVFAHLDRKQMLSAACAGGLASVFGAPIGGVLFSIEVTSTYYPVTNYWTAFCCAMVGSFTDTDKPFAIEYLYLAALGLLMGISGVCFIAIHDWYVYLRRKYQSRFLGDNPYGIAIAVVFIFTTLLFFIGDFAIEPARRGVADMFNIQYLSHCDKNVFDAVDLECNDCDCITNKVADNPTLCEGGGSINEIICKQKDWCNCYYHDWVEGIGLYFNLSAVYLINFLFTICAVTLSYPCGIFSPIFTLGSVFGRIFGEVFREFVSPICDPRVYSVVGAATMASAVTQTISPAVIALEITQDLSLAVPCLFAVIIAGGVSKSILHSFYDSVLQLRGIPMLPIRPTVAYKRIFIKSPLKRRRTKSPRSPKSQLSSVSEKLSLSPMTSPLSMFQRANSKEIKHMKELDLGRSGVDANPEIYSSEDFRSIDNDKIMVIDSAEEYAKPEAMYRLLIADDVMDKEFCFVEIDPSPQQLVEMLTANEDQEWFVMDIYVERECHDRKQSEFVQSLKSSDLLERKHLDHDSPSKMFPIVHNQSEAVLVGEARRAVLMDLLKTIDGRMYEEGLPAEMRMTHLTFYNQSKTEIMDKASLLNDSTLLHDIPRSVRKSTTIQMFTAKVKNKLFYTENGNENGDNQIGDGTDVLLKDVEMDMVREETESPEESEHKIRTTLMSSGFIERINLSPIQVISEMPLTKIYTLFHILKPQNVYVTKYSRLIGVINEVNLLKREFATQQTATGARMCALKCNKLCRDCRDFICCCCS